MILANILPIAYVLSITIFAFAIDRFMISISYHYTKKMLVILFILMVCPIVNIILAIWYFIHYYTHK